MGFVRPHLPFIAPESFFDLYPDPVPVAAVRTPPENMPSSAWSKSAELLEYDDLKDLLDHKPIAEETLTSHNLPTHMMRKLRRGYYACVSHVDHEVGKVINALEVGPFATSTVVVFTGDHGYMLGELGMWTKHTNFEIAVHAPLMFRVPGVTGNGITSTAYTEHQDIFPTVVHFASNGAASIKECPKGKKQLSTRLCTMGRNLAALTEGGNASHDFVAAFSQFNRDSAKDSEASNCVSNAKHPAKLLTPW